MMLRFSALLLLLAAAFVGAEAMLMLALPATASASAPTLNLPGFLFDGSVDARHIDDRSDPISICWATRSCLLGRSRRRPGRAWR